MARRFAKVSEEKIEEAFLYQSDLVNTKTIIPLRVGEGRWIYPSMLHVLVYIHHYLPTLQGIVVYYSLDGESLEPIVLPWKCHKEHAMELCDEYNNYTFKVSGLQRYSIFCDFSTFCVNLVMSQVLY